MRGCFGSQGISLFLLDGVFHLFWLSVACCLILLFLLTVDLIYSFKTKSTAIEGHSSYEKCICFPELMWMLFFLENIPINKIARGRGIHNFNFTWYYMFSKVPGPVSTFISRARTGLFLYRFTQFCSVWLLILCLLMRVNISLVLFPVIDTHIEHLLLWITNLYSVWSVCLFFLHGFVGPVCVREEEEGKKGEGEGEWEGRGERKLLKYSFISLFELQMASSSVQIFFSLFFVHSEVQKYAMLAKLSLLTFSFNVYAFCVLRNPSWTYPHWE